MLKLIDQILQQFRICFKREETFTWFIIIVVGILGRGDMRGVSSIVGCLCLEPNNYESMLHFFRSKAYELSKIKSIWQDIVLKQTKTVQMDGYIFLIGDHIKVTKEARYMPGVKKLHQDSENVGKAEYIFGHQFGMVGVLADGKTHQCIPMDIELQDGIDEVNSLKDESPAKAKGQKKGSDGSSSINKMIQMCGNLVKSKSQRAIGLLDAYFTTGETYKYCHKVNEEQGSNVMVVISRAKANTVAYEEPESPVKRGRGQPRKYGRKVNLKELFRQKADCFQTAIINLYGKEETVKYLCVDLIWKPLGKKLRFVLVKTNEKLMILACSDLKMHPEKIIIAYSYRFKIEVTFKMLKHVIGGFFYHFWTNAVPKLSRLSTNNDLSVVTEKKDKERIISTMRAIEVFTFLSCIAMGILTMISVKIPDLVWNKFFGWLRTRSSEIPSIETVRSVLQQELWMNTYVLSRYETLSSIKKYQKPYCGDRDESSA